MHALPVRGHGTDTAVTWRPGGSSTVPSRPEYIGPYDERGRRGDAFSPPGTSLSATNSRRALADGARALHEAGDLRASRDSFERAYRLAEPAGDAESMALAALGLAGLWVAEGRTVTSTVLLEARLQHVLTLLDPRSALALRVRIRLAGEADYARGTHAAVLAALDEVRAELARAAGAAGEARSSWPRRCASPTTACSARSTSPCAGSLPSS